MTLSLKERGSRRTSFGLAVISGIHGIKTMVIVSDYDIDFNENDQVFG